jgi:hypothetical protein
MVSGIAGCASDGANDEIDRKQTILAGIEKRCGVAVGTLRLSGEELSIQPSPDEEYENLACALRELEKSELAAHVKLGFVGNEMHPREEK